MPVWIIAIISVAIGTFVGFGLNLWRDKLLESKNKKREALERHFDELGQTILQKVLS